MEIDKVCISDIHGVSYCYKHEEKNAFNLSPCSSISPEERCPECLEIIRKMGLKLPFLHEINLLVENKILYRFHRINSDVMYRQNVSFAEYLNRMDKSWINYVDC